MRVFTERNRKRMYFRKGIIIDYQKNSFFLPCSINNAADWTDSKGWAGGEIRKTGTSCQKSGDLDLHQELSIGTKNNEQSRYDLKRGE